MGYYRRKREEENASMGSLVVFLFIIGVILVVLNSCFGWVDDFIKHEDERAEAFRTYCRKTIAYTISDNVDKCGCAVEKVIYSDGRYDVQCKTGHRIDTSSIGRCECFENVEKRILEQVNFCDKDRKITTVAVDELF